MRCRIHLDDNSSSLGVCASCLRHRLSAVSAHGRPPTVTQYLMHDTPPRSESPAPRLPPSFSPQYAIKKRNSTHNVASSDPRFFSTPQPDSVPDNNRFFSTPQARPTQRYDIVGGHKDDKGKKKSKKFSLFSKLFRSRSDKAEKKANLDSISPRDSNMTSSSSSPFKFLMKSKKKNQKEDVHAHSRLFFSEEESSSAAALSGKGARRPRRAFSDNDYYHDRDHGDPSPTESDCSSESSQGWRKTPRGGKGGKVVNSGGGSKVGSGLGLCLSPLVRAGPSPSKFWGQKSGGMLTPERSLYSSGEFRKAKSPMYLTNATSFCKSRSRKMADFGRPVRSHH